MTADSDMKGQMAAKKPYEIVVFMTRSEPKCDFCGEDPTKWRQLIRLSVAHRGKRNHRHEEPVIE